MAKRLRAVFRQRFNFIKGRIYKTTRTRELSDAFNSQAEHRETRKRVQNRLDANVADIFLRLDLVKGAFSHLTFIQPVSEAIKHNSLLPRGNQADHSALHRGSVVNVVFKYEDLDREPQNRRVSIPSDMDLKRSPHLYSLFSLPG